MLNQQRLSFMHILGNIGWGCLLSNDHKTFNTKTLITKFRLALIELKVKKIKLKMNYTSHQFLKNGMIKSSLSFLSIYNKKLTIIFLIYISSPH